MKSGLYVWNVEGTNFPKTGSDADKLRFLVNYAVLAPSKCNSQPWLFEVSGRSLYLIYDRYWAFRVADPRSRELTLSCGAALLNLRIAARHFGYTARVEAIPCPADRYLLAKVRLSPAAAEDQIFIPSMPADPGDEELFAALSQRRTHLGSFGEDSPTEAVLERCCQAAAQNGCWLHIVRDAATREEVAALVAQADHEQMANKAFRRELAGWVHTTGSRTRDGVSGSSFGLSGPFNLLTPVLRPLLWALDMGTIVGVHHRELALHSPALAVLGTNDDTPKAWLAAGQALELALLQATASGLSASFLNQPIEVEGLRSKLGGIVGREGYPQVLLRLGYAKPSSHTPRRPAEEVVI